MYVDCSGQFFDDFLKAIKLNDVAVNWPAVAAQPDSILSRINNGGHQFDDYLAKLLSAAKGYHTWQEINALPRHEVSGPGVDPPVVAWTYQTLQDLTPVLSTIGLMTDHKEGIPRTSYRGVIWFRFNGYRVLFRPHDWAKQFLEPIS